jgi:signal transduction histidine kinase
MTMTDRSRWTDRLIAAGLLVWALPDVPWWWRPAGHSDATPVVLALLALALVQSAPFLWRRRWPLPVAAIATACFAVKFALGRDLYSAGAAGLVAAYGLGAYGGARLRTATRLVTGGAFATAVVVLLTSHGERARALPFAMLAAALGMGEVTSAHRDVVAAGARHAHDEERARFARELHDVIAHELSAIAVQAGAARVAAERDPAAAAEVVAEVVATIEQAARHGLIELNRLVGALRRDEIGGAGPGCLDRAPQPQLVDLPALIGGARDTGLPVELAINGEPEPLPATVELTGYRIVQESLTNAIRYANGAPTLVLLTYATGGLEVHVEDAGGGGGGRGLAGGGRGLAGLAERARILGGRFDAGPRPAGGFAVHAWLPAER